MPSRLVSPNEMFQAAKDMQLEGREPESNHDWILVINFIAANTAEGLEKSVCKLSKMLYNIPLSDEAIEQIADFQHNHKNPSSPEDEMERARR